MSIFSYFFLYFYLILFCSLDGFPVAGFRRAWPLPKRNERSKLAVATLKRWSGELSRLIYDVRMMKNGSELRCDRAAARSGSSGGGMKGVKGPALSSAGAPWFTVDDIFSLVLVGAYRTTASDNGGLAWHFVSNYCLRSRGQSFLFRRSDRSSTERDNALFYSALFLFCFACLRFFLSRYFSAAARSLLRRRGTSTHIRPNFAALVAQIYHRNYARNSLANDLLSAKSNCANKAPLCTYV